MRAEFTDSLITGNEMIDGQHKELFAKINDLVTAIENERGAEECAKTLEFLSAYTDFHFSAEENFQKEIEYPGMPEHLKKHAEFKATIATLKEMLAEGKDGVAELVEQQVINWFYFHIQTFDRSVAEYRFMRETLS